MDNNNKATVFEYIAFVLIIVSVVGLNEMAVSMLGPWGSLLPIGCVLIPVIKHKLNNKRFL